MLYFTDAERTVPLSKQLFHSGFSFSLCVMYVWELQLGCISHKRLSVLGTMF